ncbi:hypothetical protein L208DRAFT_1376738 [Tricholoma matsutake]|nr:hypothetical protein L208DRAFT_1376738 [Tricholoma matsutake 945]
MSQYLINLQAMQFVITACADQEESLLKSLNGNPYRSYNLLSGGDPNYANKKYTKLLAIRDKYHTTLLGHQGSQFCTASRSQMNEEYPANIANYMDGLIKKHWTTNGHHTSETALNTPDEVSIFIFHEVMTHEDSLELAKMTALINNYLHWKTLITTISTKVMPLHTTFIKWCQIIQPPPPAQSSTAIPLSMVIASPATITVSASTSITAGLQPNTASTSIISPFTPPIIPENLSPAASHQIKAELLEKAASNFQLPSTDIELLSQDPSPTLQASLHSHINPEILHQPYPYNTINPQLLSLNNTGPAINLSSSNHTRDLLEKQDKPTSSNPPTSMENPSTNKSDDESDSDSEDSSGDDNNPAAKRPVELGDFQVPGTDDDNAGLFEKQPDNEAPSITSLHNSNAPDEEVDQLESDK